MECESLQCIDKGLQEKIDKMLEESTVKESFIYLLEIIHLNPNASLLVLLPTIVFKIECLNRWLFIGDCEEVVKKCLKNETSDAGPFLRYFSDLFSLIEDHDEDELRDELRGRSQKKRDMYEAATRQFMLFVEEMASTSVELFVRDYPVIMECMRDERRGSAGWYYLREVCGERCGSEVFVDAVCAMASSDNLVIQRQACVLFNKTVDNLEDVIDGLELVLGYDECCQITGVVVGLLESTEDPNALLDRFKRLFKKWSYECQDLVVEMLFERCSIDSLIFAVTLMKASVERHVPCRTVLMDVYDLTSCMNAFLCSGDECDDEREEGNEAEEEDKREAFCAGISLVMHLLTLAYLIHHSQDQDYTQDQRKEMQVVFRKYTQAVEKCIGQFKSGSDAYQFYVVEDALLRLDACL